MVHPLVSARLAALLHPIGAVILGLVGLGAITAFAVLQSAPDRHRPARTAYPERSQSRRELPFSPRGLKGSGRPEAAIRRVEISACLPQVGRVLS